jgi:hypothetical protein
MPPPNPIMRIERVARDLEALADELEEYAGPDAKRALLHWRSELLEAIEALKRSGAASAGSS